LSIGFRVSRKGPRNCRSLGFARDDKKERVVERRGPLPRARAVVGAVATSISSPFCEKSKKVTTSPNDKEEGGCFQ
jgi:hypothetical protein